MNGSTHKPRYNQDHADWYDSRYYDKIREEEPQWYAILLQQLEGKVNRDTAILEVGCGQSYGLRKLIDTGKVIQENVYGIDQSEAAVNFMSKTYPGAHFSTSDIYSLPYHDGVFDMIFMTEVIEHLEHPREALREVARVIAPQGFLYLSFPNFSFLPWRAARHISDTYDKPELINKQPIDMVYSVAQVQQMVQSAGFVVRKITGVTYLTAHLGFIESRGDFALTRALNSLGLARCSLHPLFTLHKVRKV